MSLDLRTKALIYNTLEQKVEIPTDSNGYSGIIYLGAFLYDEDFLVEIRVNIHSEDAYESVRYNNDNKFTIKLSNESIEVYDIEKNSSDYFAVVSYIWTAVGTAQKYKEYWLFNIKERISGEEEPTLKATVKTNTKVYNGLMNINSPLTVEDKNELPMTITSTSASSINSCFNTLLNSVFDEDPEDTVKEIEIPFGQFQKVLPDNYITKIFGLNTQISGNDLIIE